MGVDQYMQYWRGSPSTRGCQWLICCRAYLKQGIWCYKTVASTAHGQVGIEALRLSSFIKASKAYGGKKTTEEDPKPRIRREQLKRCPLLKKLFQLYFYHSNGVYRWHVLEDHGLLIIDALRFNSGRNNVKGASSSKLSDDLNGTRSLFVNEQNDNSIVLSSSMFHSSWLVYQWVKANLDN